MSLGTDVLAGLVKGARRGWHRPLGHDIYCTCRKCIEAFSRTREGKRLMAQREAAQRGARRKR